LAQHQQQDDKKIVVEEIVLKFETLMGSDEWALVKEAGEDQKKSQTDRLLAPQLSSEDVHYIRGYIAGIKDTLAIPEHSVASYKNDLLLLEQETNRREAGNGAGTVRGGGRGLPRPFNRGGE
jgi:hypothetical protein